INAETSDIVVAELTPDDVGDVSAVPDLLEQIDSSVASLIADGAYDGETVYDAVAERHPGAAVIIPPRATAVANESARPAHCDDCAAWSNRLAASIGLQSKEHD